MPITPGTPFTLVSAALSRGREYRDFLAVAIELTRAHLQRFAGLFLQQRQAQARFVPALLHRQLEVEDSVPAPTLAQPRCHAFGHAAGLLDHVAHHPVERHARLPVETVFAQMFGTAA